MISYEKNLMDFGEQLSFKKLVLSGLDKLAKMRPDGIVVFGMGGSGLPGLILKKLADEIKITVPVTVVRDRKLPRLFFKRPIFVAVSFSGGTAETIDVFNSALRLRNKAGLAAVTGGGRLRSLALKNHLPLAAFGTRGLTPREASGMMFYGIVRILKSVFPLQISSSIKLTNPNRSGSLGKKLAEAARNRNVLIYTQPDFSHLGYIWKTNFNETAKIPAFSNTYPEVNHNEIAGFERKSGHWTIFWIKSGNADDKKIKKIEKILGRKGIKNIEIALTGKNKQEKTWNGIVLSHWTALALAKLNKVNPRKAAIINELNPHT